MRNRVSFMTLNTLLNFSDYDPSPHTCAAGARMSTVHDVRPTQATAHHATRVRSHWESG